jgi:CBS domain-containing protein
MNIASIMKKQGNLITISGDKTLVETAIILNQKHIGALPVVDDTGNLIGIISERDIIRSCANQGAGALETAVNAAMTTKVETATLQDSIDSALARMTDRRIRHLPVLEDGKLVAIVSIGDLVKAQIDQVLAEADAMRAYIHS